MIVGNMTLLASLQVLLRKKEKKKEEKKKTFCGAYRMLRVDIDEHIKSNHRVRKVNLVDTIVCVCVCVSQTDSTLQQSVWNRVRGHAC